MKAHIFSFRIDSDLRVLDCNPPARVLLSIVDTPIDTYLLKLLDGDSVAAVWSWLMMLNCAAD